MQVYWENLYKYQKKIDQQPHSSIDTYFPRHSVNGYHYKIALETMSLKIFAIIFVGSAILLSVCHCQEETTCGGEEVKLTALQKFQIQSCLDATGKKSVWKIPADKLLCFGVCVLEKKGMLTPTGKIDHAKAIKYIEDAISPKLRKPLVTGIDKCIKEHGQDVKVKNDPGCMSFMAVGQCVHDVYLEVCIGDD
ncbi:uncharacterized protein LOC110844281 [Folsomia candida]|uniref:Uncharacterized protein n=1 Tax=Folsomia candida TaxID=158441 RepID=A0A226EPX9_FOLCA|nr:uncharacterized protein LOC110844281 [Folsomia candida]OXA59207.1 hypothetical protein Fcan01_04696 [Folsomia candida]